MALDIASHGLCSGLVFFFLMIRRPPRSTLFPYTNALPIYPDARSAAGERARQHLHARHLCHQQVVHVGDGPGRHEAVHARSEEHTSELQSRLHLVCRLLLEKKKINDMLHACLSTFADSVVT